MVLQIYFPRKQKVLTLIFNT